MPGLLAHQGGWDEILLVAGPMILIMGMIAVVKKRVDRAAAERTEQPHAPAEPPPN